MKSYTKICESEYGDNPNNFHISKHGDEIHVELTYPNIATGSSCLRQSRICSRQRWCEVAL